MPDIGKSSTEIELSKIERTTSGSYNRDDDSLEAASDKLDTIIGAVGSDVLQITEEQSDLSEAEEDAEITVSISLTDVDDGPVPAASIDITGASASVQKSTGSGYSTAGITQPGAGGQPSLSKALGEILLDEYKLLAAEWAVGDGGQIIINDGKVTSTTPDYFVRKHRWMFTITENATTAANVVAVKAVTDLIPDGGAMTSIAQEATVAKDATVAKASALTSHDTAVLGAIAALNDLSAAAAADQVWDELIAGHVAAGSFGEFLQDMAGATFATGTDSLEAISDSAAAGLITVTDSLGGIEDGTTDSIHGKIGTDTEMGDDSLYDLLIGNNNAANRAQGKNQVKTRTVAVAADGSGGVVTLWTVTNSNCLIKGIVVKANTASQTDLTNIVVQGGASNVIDFIDATEGAVANLDAVDEQVAWTGLVELAATKTITMTLTGTGVTPVDLQVSVRYEAIVNGAFLT